MDFRGISHFIAISLFGVLITSCDQSLPEKVPENPETITGHVEVGPFAMGTPVKVYTLDSNLAQSETWYTTHTDNLQGRYAFKNIEIREGYVRVEATGRYFNLVSGEITSAPLKLSVWAHTESWDYYNINALSYISQGLVERFLNQNQYTFREVKERSGIYIYRQFGIVHGHPQYHPDKNPIIKGFPPALELLAISLVLQGNRNIPTLQSLLDQLRNDLLENGEFSRESIQQILTGVKNINIEKVKTNFRKKYAGKDDIINRLKDLEPLFNYVVETLEEKIQE